MKTRCSPLLLLSLLFLLPGPACSADDGEGGAADDADESPPDAAVASPPDAADPAPPDAAASGAFTLDGDVVGPEIPADAEVIVAWAVSATNPDHAYKYGDGASDGPRYVISLEDGPPPDLAVNDYGGGRRVALGFALLVPTGTDIPEGILDPEADLTVLGASPTPIIWREGTLGGELDWADEFEEATYGCGRCVPAPEGETFDGFEPIDCGELVIEAPPVDNDCNWT